MIFSIQYLSYIYLQPIEIFLPINVTFAKRTPAPMVGLTSIERNGVVQNLTQKMGEQI